MPRRPFRIALAIVLGSVLLLGIAAAFVRHEILSYPDRKGPGKGQVVVLEVPKGSKLPAIATLLHERGLVDRPRWFRFYAMHRGDANRIRAGRYELTDDMPPKALLAALVAGVKEEDVEVTIPEGLHLREVIGVIVDKGLGDAAALEAVARDPAWLKEQGIAGETAEGYLFPDTYRFKRGVSPARLLAELVRHHREVYAALRKAHARDVDRLQKDLRWGDRELVIMASIVEKETGALDDPRRIASVFYNRLLRDSFTTHRLETDPTIRYGCTIPPDKTDACKAWDPSDRLHRAQLDDAGNRYNTYQHAGLPPGPIANPGRSSLAAALSPADTDDLFFVAKDGKSYFSRTFAEHQRKVDKYILGK